MSVKYVRTKRAKLPIQWTMYMIYLDKQQQAPLSPKFAFWNLNSFHAGTFFTSDILSSADFFLKLTFSKIYFRNTSKVSNTLDLDQDRHPVGPDLGPNCFQRLTADDITK